VPGSPLNAINTRPPFAHYYFIDLHPGKTENLRGITKDFSNVTVSQGDCNRVLIEDIFPLLAFERYTRALCLLDPYGLHLNWEVIKKAGELRTVEIFLNFPVADINRNAVWRDRKKVSPEQAARLTAYWGDKSWMEIAYDTSEDLFKHPIKTDNDTIAEAFRERLKSVAGFEHVPKPLPMRNRSNAIVYYLYFASPDDTGNKIVKDIFNKYKERGIS
jgi:three-Cys-motif partner protein